ncbi:MAG: hypothetical protein JXA98_08505 [Methanosarcinaceae archaeon]|nr:hypothetical protein [Methanosarcinaceae archaeon]
MKHMKNGQLSLVILIFIMTTLIVPASAGEVTVSIGNIAADTDGTCMVAVVMESVSNYGTGAITIEYDPSIVHVTDVTGSEDSTVVAWNADNDIGEVKIAAWNLYGISGHIDFATITFEDAGKSGSTPLTVKVDELITYDPEGNQIKIEAKAINGKYTSSAKSTPGFGLFAGVSVLLITLQVLSKKK